MTAPPRNLKVQVNHAKLHRPTADVAPLLRHDTFSPLRGGGDNLMTPDVRVSYHELATLISRSMGWPIGHVLNNLTVRLYCSSRVIHPSGDVRTYWSTSTRYPYFGGLRRDVVQVDLGNGNIGLAQLTAFIEMEDLPVDVQEPHAHAVLIRWMHVSTLSHARDPHGRPMCEYPLSSNHCLWQWADAGANRLSFSVRGFRLSSTRKKMWNHLPSCERAAALESERRAYYDVRSYREILDHANVSVDPTTGHMLQTLQMI